MPQGIRPLDELYATYIDATPQDADWSEGWPERWDFVEAERVEFTIDEFNDLELECTCGEPVGVFKGELHHAKFSDPDDVDVDPERIVDVETDDECDVELELDDNQRLLEITADEVVMAVAGSGWIEAFGREVQLEGPMMNYRYPISFDRVGNTFDAAFALIDTPLVVVTMDDESYIALSGGGMDFSWEICEAYMRLGYLPPTHFTPPRSCKQDNELNRAIVAAYKQACEFQMGWMQRRIEQANEAIG